MSGIIEKREYAHCLREQKPNSLSPLQSAKKEKETRLLGGMARAYLMLLVNDHDLDLDFVS